VGIVEAIGEWAQTTVGDHGLWAVFVLMVLESMCIPIPSEVTMMFAGFLVSQGQMDFWAAVLVGSFANLVGSWIAWAAGAYGVDSALMRYGHYRRHIEQAHVWFERHGTSVVFFSRMLPVIRTFISLPAGVARMPLGRFSVLTFAGCVPWCIFLVWLGWLAGDQWDEWQEYLHLLDYVIVAAIAATIIVWSWRRRRRRSLPAHGGA
jgi:membrane protein DedA with SNARE-associated domain